MNEIKLETTTIWNFPTRGSWATHEGLYRSNWSPYIPHNMIRKYSKENDTVCDLFCGIGTTLIEAKLLNRNSVGVDINPKAIEISKDKLKFNSGNNSSHNIKLESATNTSIDTSSINLICMHPPPYSNIIKYSNGIKEDLSLLEIDEFIGK